MRTAPAVLLPLLLLCAAPARASTPDLFGVGSRASAMGGAFTAVADDFSAVYYNPAGLNQVRHATLSIAPVLGSFDVWVKDPGAARRSFDLPPLRGLYAGLVAPFGRLFGNDNLSLGVLLYVPFDYVMQTYVPPRADSRYLPVFHDAYRRAAFSLAAAYRVLPELSVGIGVDLFMDLAGGSVITFGERTTEWEEHYGVDIDVTREIELDPALLAGVLANPWPWLSVGVSYRMEERADTALVPNSFLIGGFDVDLAIHYANFFRPHQVSVGACLRAPEWLGLSADVTWSRWSSYLDPHSDTVSPPFSDTWTPRAGVEARVAKMLSLSAGAFYVPSPVPDQVGVSSFVDGDRLGGSLGVAWLLDLMPEPWRLPLTLRAHVQLQRMTERETVKDAARLPDADADRAGKQIVNAGYPGFSSGGSIVAGGITLSWVVP